MRRQHLPLPIRPLNSGEITEFLRENSKIFKGVYACNEIPGKLTQEKEFAIICNLSPNTNPGTHWISIYCNSDMLIYFDSYGLPSLNENISKFMEKCKRNFYWNATKLQNDTSDCCGYYSMLFILFHEKLARNWLKLDFTDNLPENDKKCINYLQKIIAHED